MPVNSHVVGRSRNCTEPIARLRDPGGSGHSVAQLLCGLDDRLSLCRESYVLARISSKWRCAKREQFAPLIRAGLVLQYLIKRRKGTGSIIFLFQAQSLFEERLVPPVNRLVLIGG